jgi:hypothetical protein
VDSESDALSLPNWIAHVFDHPVADQTGDRWYHSLDSAEWDDGHDWYDSPERSCERIASTFERSGELLANFSDEQLEQGLWYLVDNGNSDFMFALIDPAAPASVRLRALRSFLPLFEQVMAVRCSPHLSYMDETETNALNGICYMWWDVLPIHDRADQPERAEFDAEVLAVLRRQLAVPHDAVRESALHGLNHWRSGYRSQVREIVDQFLHHTPGIRRELGIYAVRVRDWYVQ